MGVVYLGHDTRFDHAVAIRSLPAEVAADPERLARFEREARTLAQLDHPNLAGIYGPGRGLARRHPARVRRGPPDRVDLRRGARGHLLYVKRGMLLRCKVDLASATLVGDPVVVTRDIESDLSTWHGQFSANPSGVLAYSRMIALAGGGAAEGAGYSAGGEGDRTSSFARDGRLQTVYADGIPMVGFDLTQDGRNIMFTAGNRDGTSDLRTVGTAFASSAMDEPEAFSNVMDPDVRRLTFLDGSEERPVWSPDGTEVAFYWDGGETGTPGIYRKQTCRSKEGSRSLSPREANPGTVVTPRTGLPMGDT